MTIKVDGGTKRSFVFPAPLEKAFLYYSQAERILKILPHIEFVKAFGPHSFRMAYHSLELGVYLIRIYCDLQLDIDPVRHILRFYPLAGQTPVAAQSGLNSSTVQGVFESQSSFFDEGPRTRIEYQLELHARLPVPVAAQVLPAGVRDHIAGSITTWRIRDIADGFIHQSIQHYSSGK